MTIYDAAIAIVVVAGMVRGAWRGITWQLASIGSLVLGYLTAYPISAQLVSYFPGEPEVARATSMAAAYAVVSGAVFGAAWVVRETLHKLKFDAFDRHLGMILGGIEAFFVGILVTLFVVSLAPSTRQPIFASPTGRVLGTVMSSLGPVLPGEVREVLAPFWNAALPGDALATDLAPPSPAVETKLPAFAEPVASGDDTGPGELPPLPALEPIPRHDTDVRKTTSRPSRTNAVLPLLEIPADSASSTVEGLIDRGKHAVDRAVAETLDSDPDQKASSLRQLADKQKQRLKDTVASAVGKSKEKVGTHVQDRLSKEQKKIQQSVSSTVNRAQQQLEKSITDSVDESLRALGGLEPAPAPAPKKGPR